MANKVAAVLVMCLVVVTLFELPMQAEGDKFGSCFNNCEKECIAGGMSQSDCEMKCDTDCFNKDVAARVEAAELAPGAVPKQHS
ncbi:hypothetical protein JCGZ_16274 [Jatropha curcas]|uniref:Major pollen allergen Ole e 6-like n=1 Tax=Jatropha curcas TaxID=180498 RepID=A0A067L7K7_JATCU|nr:uncharacterized protein LOC105650718 [Jatropha curcas]KDP44441.1 hypothetical protein JCGZ_16274 [Jatropha curcas]